MRRTALLAALVLGLVVVGLAVAAFNGRWSTHLSGSLEVPVNGSHGQGQATFKLSKDGTALDYKLIASNIDNVFMAHIHAGAPGASGPIVVWLYSSNGTTTQPQSPGALPKGTGPQDGVLAEGTIHAADLVGPLAGQPLASLVALMENGGAYVNLHTDDGVAPPNTGPGDLFPGEIRGNLP